MHVRELFPSKFVTAEDLGRQEHQAVIAGIRIEKVGQQEEQRPVLHFQGHTKGMVLNRTNAKRIAEVFGDDTDRWMGQTITLYPSETEYAGEVTPCVRVRVTAPPFGQQQQPMQKSTTQQQTFGQQPELRTQQQRPEQPPIQATW
jgi:hypothetical protein